MERMIKNKRVLSAVFTGILILFTLLTAYAGGIPARAASADSAVISVKTLRADAGDTVTVEVTVDPKEGFCGFAVALEYDTKILQFDKDSFVVSKDYLPDYDGKSPKYAVTNTEGKCGYPVLFQCTLDPSYPVISKKCTLVQATFRVASSAKDGAYAITPHIDCTGGCYYTMGTGAKTVNLPAVMQTGYLLIGNAAPPSTDPEPPTPGGNTDPSNDDDPLPPSPTVDPEPSDDPAPSVDPNPNGQGTDDSGDVTPGEDPNDDKTPVTPGGDQDDKNNDSNNGNGNGNGNGNDKTPSDPPVVPGTDDENNGNGGDDGNGNNPPPANDSDTSGDRTSDTPNHGENGDLDSDRAQEGDSKTGEQDEKGISPVTVVLIVLLLLLAVAVIGALLLILKPELQKKFFGLFKKKQK